MKTEPASPPAHRAMNFNAGPATLPLPALERARRELLDLDGGGASVMEISHRGKAYGAVQDEATSLLRELLAVPPSHHVLFLAGGASLRFAELPMNFLANGRTAEYVVNGAWGEKALAEARVVAALQGGAVRVACDTGVREGSSVSYTRAPGPGEIESRADAAYLHVTSNETIHGIELGLSPERPFPRSAAPLVCDMSSDFLSRELEVAPFSFLYAGAQKNIGPSGLVVAIAREDFLARARKDIPKILQYRVHAENGSLYNTPPTFAVYLVRNVLAWIKELGGLPGMEQLNRDKSAILYGAIEANRDFYKCPVERESRSRMNVVFRLPTPDLEDRFVEEAKRHDMVGLKGHRTVGGIRVSLYNAVPIDWVQALAGFMQEFARTHG